MGALFLPGQLYTLHRGNTSRTMSSRPWNRALEFINGSNASSGFFMHEDFRSFGLSAAVATNVGRYVGDGSSWYSFEDTGAAISQIATNVNGVISLTTDADDNQEVDLVNCGNTGVCGVISDTAGNDKFQIFEARFSVSQIVTQNIFLGMGEEGLAVDAGIIADSGDHTSKDLFGFSVNEDASSTLVLSYRKAGQTEQFPITSLATLAASTFVNVAWVYDPTAPRSKRVSVYLNNDEQSTYVTADNIAAATFPGAEEMAIYAAVKNVTDITTLNLDSIAFYQAG